MEMLKKPRCSVIYRSTTMNQVPRSGRFGWSRKRCRKSFWGGSSKVKYELIWSFTCALREAKHILVTECENKKHPPDLVPGQLRRSSFTFTFHVERVFQSYIFPPRNLMSLTSSLPTNPKIMQPLPSWAFPQLGCPAKLATHNGSRGSFKNCSISQ